MPTTRTRFADCHVTKDQCPRCDWSGMHWHWDADRFRSLSELSPDDRAAFDLQLRWEQS